MDVYQSFENLVQQGKHQEVVNLLNEFMVKSNLSVLEKGWALWNISDRYALMREPILEHQNHVRFVEWGKRILHPDKLHWFVSDATQALSLSLDNKLDEWIDWYEYACLNSSKNKGNRGIRFESHRAMAYTLIKIGNLSNIEIPLQRMNELLREDENWENIIFSKITYHSLLLEKGHQLNEQGIVEEAKGSIISMLNTVLSEIEKDQEKKKHLLGSWEQLNASRQSKNAMMVLLNNLGCSFSKTFNYTESVQVFNTAIHTGHKLNKYGLSMYLLSNWELNKNRIEVENLFDKLGKHHYSFNDLFQFAPSLEEVIR